MRVVVLGVTDQVRLLFLCNQTVLQVIAYQSAKVSLPITG